MEPKHWWHFVLSPSLVNHSIVLVCWRIFFIHIGLLWQNANVFRLMQQLAHSTCDRHVIFVLLQQELTQMMTRGYRSTRWSPSKHATKASISGRRQTPTWRTKHKVTFSKWTFCLTKPQQDLYNKTGSESRRLNYTLVIMWHHCRIYKII